MGRDQIAKLANNAIAYTTAAGRSLIYAARFDTMNALINYLTENCCGRDVRQHKPGNRAAKRRREAV